MNPNNSRITRYSEPAWTNNVAAANYTELQARLTAAASATGATQITINGPIYVPASSSLQYTGANAVKIINGSSNVIDGTGAARSSALIVTTNAASQLYVTGMSISGNNINTGDKGGAINSVCDTFLTDVIISGTQAGMGGGVYVTGDILSLSNTHIGNCSATNGGGVYSTSGVELTDGSTVHHCHATLGGGLFLTLSANLTIDGGAEISNNTADEDGGGVYTQKNINMIDGKIYGNTATSGNGGGAYVGGITMLPVGFVFASTVALDMAQLLGYGTWSQFAQGRTLVSVDPNQTKYNAPGKTGGEKTHVLTIAEMPTHKHLQRLYVAKTNSTSTSDRTLEVMTRNRDTSDAIETNGEFDAGGNSPHQNMPPYVTVYFYQRTA